MYLIPQTMPVEARLERFRQLAIEWSTRPSVLKLAAQIADAQRIAEADGRIRSLEAAALARIQRQSYIPDPDGPDVVRDVQHTIDFGGDCEDLSILLAAVLRALGFQWQIVWIDRDETGRLQSHVTVQVLGSDGHWQYAEPSIPGAELGEDPVNAAYRLMVVRRLG